MTGLIVLGYIAIPFKIICVILQQKLHFFALGIRDQDKTMLIPLSKHGHQLFLRLT